MIHGIPQDQHIQDPQWAIPHNEPVWLLRGNDPSAPAALRVYADILRENAGIDEDEIEDLANKADDQAAAMEAYQEELKNPPEPEEEPETPRDLTLDQVISQQ